MSTILRFKRGTTAELASLTESLGEIAVDTSKKTLVVMDGVTAGGTPLATTAIATQSAAGLLSAADKAKLDGLGGTGTYTLPTASTTVLGGVKVDGSTITISNGVISAVGGGTDSQTLTLSGTTLSISGGNSVSLASLANTDSQSLTLSGTTLSISGGNSVDLSSLGGTGGGAATLGELTDVSVAGATAGQALVFDGTNWSASTLSGGGVASATPTVEGIVLGRTSTDATAANVGLGINALNAVAYANDGAGTIVGDRNIAIGANAAVSLTTGRSNTAIGSSALQANVSGQNNTVIGSSAGYRITGNENVGVGGNTVLGIAFGSRNTAIGYSSMALYTAQTAGTLIEDNTGVGRASLSSMSGLDPADGTTPINTNWNIAVGNNAMSALKAGNTNTAIGGQAGNRMTKGSRNVFIGNFAGNADFAGPDITEATNCIAIGEFARLTGTTPSNQITIGNYDHDRLVIPGLGIDTANATDGQVLAWNTANGGFVWADAGTGGTVDLTNYYTKTEVDTAIAGVSAGAPDLSLASVGDLGDVDTTTTAATAGQALVWDGTNWAPGDVAATVDLTNYARTDVDETFDGTLRLNGVVQGPEFKTRKSVIQKMLLQSSTEGGLVYSPSFINDWAYATVKGDINVTVSDRDGVVTQPTSAQIRAFFDAEMSYWGISNATFANGNEVYIELELVNPQARISYSGEVGLQFQSSGYGFGATYGKIEFFKEDQQVWVTGVEETGMLYGNYLIAASNQDGTNNGYQNISRVRYTIAKDTTTYTNDVRINTLFSVDSSSSLGTSLFMPKNGGTINGGVTVTDGNLMVTGHQYNATDAAGNNLGNDFPALDIRRYPMDANNVTDRSGTLIPRAYFGLQNWDDDLAIHAPVNTDADGTVVNGRNYIVRYATSINTLQLYGGGTGVAKLQISNNEIKAVGGAKFSGDGSLLTNLPSGATTLAELTDVDTTATAGQVLTSDGAGNFTFTDVSGTGGTGSSAVKAVKTVTANGQTGTLSIVANGTQADLDAVTVTASVNGDVITVGNVAAGLMLTSVTFHQAGGFNTTTSWKLEYPEVGGATTLVETTFPTGLHYNNGGVVQAANLWTIANNAGTVSATKSNLIAGTEYYLTVKIV